MLFFVKVRVDVSKLAEFGRKIQSGEFNSHPQSTYCLRDDPAVGLNIWEAESVEDFEQKFAPQRGYYAEVYEVTPVILAAEAQQMLIKQMMAGQ